MHLQIDRYRGNEDSHHVSHDKGEEETEHPPQWRPQYHLARGEFGYPAEDLRSAGNGDHHAGCREVGFRNLRDAGGKHVVDPEAECDKRGGDQRKDEHQVTEDVPPAEGGHDSRHDGRSGMKIR
ncbi:hypothetical protein [Terriglobus sp.]|uniref:hypothetical protein n=1 Tax=Terriglobus sp. TaxID=1889013 RepID=UPI003B001446